MRGLGTVCEYAAYAQRTQTQWAWVSGRFRPSFGLHATSTAWMSRCGSSQKSAFRDDLVQ
jgi:hypothetical protein